MAIECIPDIENDNTFSLHTSNWFFNGGDSVYTSYETKEELLIDLKWLDTLPLYIATGIVDEFDLELLVSHTWCSGKDLTKADMFPYAFVWDREQPSTRKNTSKYYNIYGHTPVDYINQHKYHKPNTLEVTPEPEWFDGAAAIDTGCAYNIRGRGVLTGVFFPSLQIKQVKLKD